MDELGAAPSGPSPQTETAQQQIVVFTSPDVAATVGRPGLLEERAGANSVVREPAVRSDVLAQMLAATPPPESAPPSLRTAGETAAADEATGLVILSLYPELLTSEVYRHVASGWLFTARDQPHDDVATFVANECDRVGELTPDESARHLREIVGRLATDDRVVLIYNVSTYDPTDRLHHFMADTPDPFSVRAHRLIAATETLATELGASVVDVDGALAELAAAAHVMRPGTFSADAASFITEDAILLIDRSGALTGSLQAPVMRLEVPPYDRRTTQGVLATWHVAGGTEVLDGDPLFDVRFDGLAYKVGMDNPDEDARVAAKRAAKRRERGSAVLVLQVLAGSDGYVHELSVEEGARVNVGDTAAVMTPEKPAGPVVLDDTAPAFRLGMKLKEH